MVDRGVPQDKTLITPQATDGKEDTKRTEPATPPIASDSQSLPTAPTLATPSDQPLVSTHAEVAEVPTRRTRHPLIAGYEIVDVLGRGGMGIVYKVQQLHPRRIVALKMISGGEFASEDSVQRFRNEIEAAAKLQHTNIVHLYEMGT